MSVKTGGYNFRSVNNGNEKKNEIRKRLYRLLVVSRGTNLNSWGLPGGKVDRDETNVQGAIRELEEETGLQIQHYSHRLEQNEDYVVSINNNEHQQYQGNECCNIFPIFEKEICGWYERTLWNIEYICLY